MSNTTDNKEIEPEVEFEPEGSSYLEQLLRSLILAYQDAFNKNNEKNDIKFSLTITTHKVATPDGNKDCAYLRLDRSIREKGFVPKLPETNEDGMVGELPDDGWSTRLLHQEAYFFKSMKERVNPEAPWKEQLYLNCIARLTGAGLEYAELLQRLKQVEEGKKKVDLTVEERLNDLGLVDAKSMPAPLSEEDKKYVEHIKAEKAKEGLI